MPNIQPADRRRAAQFVAALALLGLVDGAQALTIDTQGYGGRYYLSGLSGAKNGSQSFALAAGNYWFDDGAFIGGAMGSSGFNFTVDASGNVACTTAAATCSGSNLSLHARSITVDSGSYGGRYILSSYAPQALTGDQSRVLIDGLLYSLDNGTGIGGSALMFGLDSAGQVTSWSPAATGSGSGSGSGTSLLLNSVAITIRPNAYSGNYTVSSYVPQSFTGNQTLELLPGLAYGVHAGNKDFYFTLDASGNVSTSSSDASASGHVLNLFAASAVPEPTSLWLATLGLVGLGWRRSRPGVNQ